MRRSTSVEAFADVHLSLSGRNNEEEVSPLDRFRGSLLVATVGITKREIGSGDHSRQSLGDWRPTDRINPLRVKKFLYV